MGYASLFTNTTGSNNTALGNGALQLNTTASNNTAVGYQAGYSNTTGTANAFFGYQSGYTNSTGNNNTTLGFQAGYSTTGSSNSFIGTISGYSNTSGFSNVGIGQGSLYSNTTASQNTAVGYGAGYALAGTGNGANIFLGYSSGSNLTTGSYNTYIGYSAQPSSSSVVGEIVLHASGGSTGKGGNTGFINPNGGGVYQGNNSAAWSITSDQRLKKNIVDNTVGLSAINAIQIRNFEYRTADEVTDLPKESAIDIKGVQLGAIAQELALVLPDCVKTESTGVMSVDTTNITWHLINAVKELNTLVTAQAAQIAALQVKVGS